MTYNTIAYIIYGITIVYITVMVGFQFHRNGIHYLLMFQPDQEMAHAINNLLLVLYYCLNIGYSIAVIYYWEGISSMAEMISSTATHIGIIVISLGIIHYFNLGWIFIAFRITKTKRINP